MRRKDGIEGEERVNEAETDVLVVGAGLGGVAGALAALKMGKRVILTEETDWIGGQLTSQAVPPDEHPWIEKHGCTASYRELRDRVREYYLRNFPLLPHVRDDPHFNPGQGYVSKLCHESRASLTAMEQMLARYLSNGQLRLWLDTVPIAVEMNGDLVSSVTLRDQLSGDETVVAAPYVLDATEMGDLLELGNVEHVIGAEGQAETNELHAPAVPNPMDQQAITWCFALAYHPDEDHTIDKPRDYDFWKSYQADFWPGPQLG